MTPNYFTLDYNVTGSERKRLVQAIARHTGADAKYLGAPSFSYQVDYFTIDSQGAVSFDDRADSEEIESLIDYLAEQGFVTALPEPDDEPEETTIPTVDGLTVTIPLSSLPEQARTNLSSILTAKGTLIRKALDVNALPVQVTEETVSFSWFQRELEADEIRAYTHFIAALCDMARKAKRVNRTEKPVESEKFAMRTMLIRMGFGGTEFKEERAILLRNLTGPAAFPTAAKEAEFRAKQKAMREAARTEEDNEVTE